MSTASVSPLSSASGTTPFDATLKYLLGLSPRAWAKLLGAGDHDSVEMLDTDLSTVSPRADNVLLFRREGLPVHSVVVLLRPQANGPATSGVLSCRDPLDGAESLWFRYRVIRLWEIPVEELLSGDVSLLPLAPVSDVAPDAMPKVIERMEQRLADLPSAKDRATLWTATYLLMGLKFTTAEVAQFLQGIPAMKESSTYQAIVDEGRVEGRVEEAKRVLLKLGSKKFGPASPDVEYLIQQKTALDEIESLLDRLIDVASWDELLGTN